MEGEKVGGDEGWFYYYVYLIHLKTGPIRLWVDTHFLQFTDSWLLMDDAFHLRRVVEINKNIRFFP